MAENKNSKKDDAIKSDSKETEKQTDSIKKLRKDHEDFKTKVLGALPGLE